MSTMPDVGCAGILVEDTFCGPMRALPSEGTLVALDDFTVRAGGCAANTAIGLARQGVSVEISGCIGHDSAGDFLLRTIKAQGVGVSKVVRTLEHRTSQTVILLVEGQDRRYLHTMGANRAFTVRHIEHGWLAQLKVFYLGGLFVLPRFDFGELAELLTVCRRSGVKTVVDVVVPQNVRGVTELKRILPLIDIFIPNEDEARALTGVMDTMDQLRAFRSAGANTVIITCGEHGSVAASGDSIWRCGTYQMTVVDQSGSGDAFASGVIRGLLLDWDMARTLSYSSALGASVTRAAGTTESLFSAAEADAFVTQNPLAVSQHHV